MRKLMILAVALCMTACHVLSPPPEDISAVKAAGQRLPELLQADQEVSSKTIDALAVSLRKHALGEAAEQADFSLYSEGATLDHAGRAFSPHPIAAITPERQAAILQRYNQDVADAEAAVKELHDAGANHPVHGDLKLLVDLLHNYVMARMTRDEAQAAIAAQAHDLLFSKKGGQ
jgi:hypothetical protein